MLASVGHRVLQCTAVSRRSVSNAARAAPDAIERTASAEPVAQIGGPPRDDQCGGGIQQHRVAIWAGRTLQQRLQRRRVQRRIAAADRLDGRARQAGILRA